MVSRADFSHDSSARAAAGVIASAAEYDEAEAHSGGLGAVILVAASDAPDHVKRFAHWTCDATADDVEVQAAVDDLPAIGGTILLSAGTFTFAGEVTIQDNIRLIGAGMGITKVVAAANYGGQRPFKTAVPASNGARPTNIEVAHLEIDGNRDNNGTGTEFSFGLLLYAPVNAYIHDCYFHDWFGDGCYIGANTSVRAENVHFYNNRVEDNGRQGLAIIGGTDVFIHDNEFVTGDLLGIDLEPNADTEIIENCQIVNNILRDGGNVSSPAINVTARDASLNAVNVLIQGNLIEDWLGDGISFSGGIDRLTIKDNIVDNCAGEGIVRVNVGTETVQRCTISGNTVTSPGGECIGILGSIADGAYLITGNRLQLGPQEGILMGAGADESVISGNQITGGGTDGIFISGATKCTVVGNTVGAGGAGDGIVLSSATYCTVVGNTVTGRGDDGIVELGSADNNLIEANDVQGNSGTGIVTLGASTIVRNNRGHVTENSGTATLGIGTTSIAVTHGLGVTPAAGDVMVTPIEAWGSMTSYYIDTYTSTQFTIRANQNPGQDVDFAWKAIVL